MYIVYQHKNKINSKVYIGITSRTPEERWGSNGCNYKSSPYFYNAIQKYGWDNFEHNILYTNLTKEEACKKEQELIKNFNSMDRNFGYNSTSGGEIFIMNEETRQKISKSLLGNKSLPFHYYDMKLKDDVFDNLEITLSPSATESQRLIIQALIDKYAPNATLKESALGKVVRLK